MSFYSIIKMSYKKLLPNSVRSAIFRNMPKSLRLMRDFVIRKLEKSADYDEIYDEKYYTDGLDPLYEESCKLIADSIIKVFRPKSVIDVGCGPGQLLLELKKRGVTCRGLDYSSAALDLCRQNGLDVTRFDLEHDMLPKDFKADLVVSTEVAEHLQEQYADRFVGILCAISDNVVITAAEPATTHIPDRSHVNEQPKEYWVEKFECNSFAYDEDIVSQFQADWKKRKIKPWFVQHLMVFRKNLYSHN